MRILITGGCGFLGSNLAEKAIRDNHSVCLLDNLSRSGSKQNLEWLKGLGQFTFIQKDIRSKSAVENVVRKFRPDVVFHLAGQVAMTTSITSPRDDFDINVGGTINMLEAVRKYAPKSALLYSSTNKVYGDLSQYKYKIVGRRYVCVDKPKGFDEQVQLEFHSPYGCSKGAADQYVLDYSRIYKLNTVVFRHSSMYGGRQYPTYDQGWISWFCLKAIEQVGGERTPVTISGNGYQVRDVLHADDMCRLYYSAARRIRAVRGEVFNVGGGLENSLSLLELFDLFHQILGIRMLYTKISVRVSDQKVFIADIGKATKMLGWRPSVDCRAGIRSALEWAKTGLCAGGDSLL